MPTSELAAVLSGGDIDLQQVLRALRKHLGMQIAFIGEFRDGRRVFRYVDADGERGPVSVGDSDPLEDSYCQRVVDGRLPGLIHDAADLLEARALPATTALPVGAHLSVPICLSDGSVYGTLCCFSTAPDEALSQRDLALMAALAELVAMQIDRERVRLAARRDMVQRVDRVISEAALRAVFQPVVAIEDGSVHSLEALTRFTLDPPRSPDLWFKDAEAVGRGLELELLTARTALAYMDRVPPGVRLSVNVSAATVTKPEFAALIDTCPPDRLTLELTEHAIVDDYPGLTERLAELRASGILLAIDDMGAGYSGLLHVLQLKPDVLKLDRSLVQHIDVDAGRQALATALVQFAARTGANVVAEGVETEAELNALAVLGVRFAQGYHIRRPAPFEELF